MKNRVSIATFLIGLTTLAGSARADMRNWAILEGRRIPTGTPEDCRRAAATAVQATTGLQAVVYRKDAYSYEVRSYTPTAHVFVYCTEYRPGAENYSSVWGFNLSIVVYSSRSSEDAYTVATRVNARFGTPNFTVYTL